MTEIINRNAGETSGLETQEPRPSPFNCDCGGQIYYDTNHIIIFGDFIRNATCEDCGKTFKVTNKNEQLKITND